MMTVIKIIFVLLLLIPIAFFMRFLLGMLMAEVPRQVMTPQREKLSRQEKAARKAAEKEARQARQRAAKKGITVQPGGRVDGAYTDAAGADPRTSGGRPAGSKSNYTPRRPEEVHRSERVPFAMPAGQGETTGGQRGSGDAYNAGGSGSAYGSGARSAADTPAVTPRPSARKARSEKQPTKRQLRKNRERARKRDRKRRAAEETEK